MRGQLDLFTAPTVGSSSETIAESAARAGLARDRSRRSDSRGDRCPSRLPLRKGHHPLVGAHRLNLTFRRAA